MPTIISIDTPTNQVLIDFIETHQSELQKYLYWKVGSYEVAEELAQETYFRFLKQPRSNSIQDLNAFMFTIATNLARDYLRNLAREQNREFVPLDIDIPDTKPSVEDIIVKQCMSNQLQQALAALPDTTREVFLLYRIDQLSYKEIAGRLNISERTVEHHLRQALLLCRSFLTKS